MLLAHVAALMSETQMSPEDLGKKIGISGMTIRRWMERPETEVIPELYNKSIRSTIFELVVEGHLSPQSRLIKTAFEEDSHSAQQAVLRVLGLPKDFKGELKDHDTEILKCLNMIGSQVPNQNFVEEEADQLKRFRNINSDWKSRISVLRKAITSRSVPAGDKFAAFGALFYLIFSFDLIPDIIPVFGLVDDFTILGIAAAYYMRKYSSRSGES